MYVLGIESSCDETSASIVSDSKKVLSNVVYSQINEHLFFGGVVPEIAARSHLEKIDIVVREALSDASLDISEISAVAGTCGPGLIGGVIVGATFAKTIAMARNIPFIAVNHIEAHAISVRITEDIEFPYLLMLLSGGHCQTCLVYDIDNFQIIGRTVDDSAGESFDKVAKLLSIGYPGGPAIEKVSLQGNEKAFPLPRPLCNKESCNFSFTGLKTAVRIASEKCNSMQDKMDLCASFQKTVVEIMSYKLKQAIDVSCKRIKAVALSGGVAANQAIRSALRDICENHSLRFCAPPIKFCTDNGAMIAWMGVEKLQRGQISDLRFPPRPRWNLQEDFMNANYGLEVM
ncbi:MAG: tRNA (adenosine(37)-N6)-threonylcarbamoyltransferase complex transferase subunit TsaD [Holosporaceae bacterium]|jgi:N6-L-threonylcarbamoyladenine synthase|nr:tRNA (adenosine(37)-N6)-threonylcarbamoyltransferase complex transferase subunit TsaD [Holosporaceae bacterium]